jgi:hypothetical protein
MTHEESALYHISEIASIHYNALISLVDKRISKELLQVISPYGIEAGMRAAQTVASESDGQRKLSEQQTEQLEYETRRAFEQYNAVDPRNRLVAYELERRWNGSLEKLTIAREQGAQLLRGRQEITEAERRKIIQLGGDFESVWTSDDCLPSVKKTIIRTVMREVIVNYIPISKELEFVIHWEGGCHTRFTMAKPVSGSEHKTAEEDIDIIRKMSVRYGDDEIARVLNKQGRRTGKGNRWSESGVSFVRKKHSIAGRKRRRENPDILSLGQAVRYCNVGHKTIGKLVKKGIVPKQQIVPWAPWEIKRSDLDSPQVKKIIAYLHKTGKLLLDELDIDAQQSLFEVNEQKKVEL